MADHNETDALFATKRKKQQEEQAEQERREEMLRKKAEMEAEIRRLEEEAKRQKEQQEEARRQAEEEARRVQEEVREAEARAARMEEMAKQAQLKQEEQKAQSADDSKKAFVQLGKEQLGKIRQGTDQLGKMAQEKITQGKEQLEKKKQGEAQQGEKPQEKKKMPTLYLVIGLLGGLILAIILLIAIVLWAYGDDDTPDDTVVSESSVVDPYDSDDYLLSGEDVYGIHFDWTASAQVLGYNVYYPDSFEEVSLDNYAFFRYGSAYDGDYAYVMISGITMDDMLGVLGSTDPADLVRYLEETTLGEASEGVYETITDSNRTAYSSEYHVLNIGSEFTGADEEVATQSAIMVLEAVDGDGYLFAAYGTMSDSHVSALEETVVRFLDHTS